MDELAPMKTIVKKKKLPKWMTAELRLNMNKQKEARRVLQKKGIGNRRRKKAKKQRAEAKQRIEEAKISYYDAHLHHKLDAKKWDHWGAVKEFGGEDTNSAPTELEVEGKELKTDAELAKAMNDQYEKKENEVQKALGNATRDYLTRVREKTKNRKANFEIRPILEVEVMERINKCKNKESFGEDEICYKFIKKLKHFVVKELTGIFNHSIRIKRFPRRWKTSKIKPLYKGDNKNRKEPSSYRPVALLAALGRIMEALIAKQLDYFEETNNLIHEGVHGFRKGRSTATAMLETWEYITWETQANKIVAVDLLDLSAAFDTLEYLYILRKMK